MQQVCNERCLNNAASLSPALTLSVSVCCSRFDCSLRLLVAGALNCWSLLVVHLRGSFVARLRPSLTQQSNRQVAEQQINRETQRQRQRQRQRQIQQQSLWNGVNGNAALPGGLLAHFARLKCCWLEPASLLAPLLLLATALSLSLSVCLCALPQS